MFALHFNYQRTISDNDIRLSSVEATPRGCRCLVFDFRPSVLYRRRPPNNCQVRLIRTQGGHGGPPLQTTDDRRQTTDDRRMSVSDLIQRFKSFTTHLYSTRRCSKRGRAASLSSALYFHGIIKIENESSVGAAPRGRPVSLSNEPGNCLTYDVHRGRQDLEASDDLHR